MFWLEVGEVGSVVMVLKSCTEKGNGYGLLADGIWDS